MSVSFQVDEPGLEHQVAMPEVPPPEDLPSQQAYHEMLAEDAPDSYRDWFERDRAFEERSLDPINWFRPTKKEPYQRIWLKTNESPPNDEPLHQALLAYASDMALLDTSAMPHGVGYFDPGVQIASLDHAMWFHRPFRIDEWLLYVTDSPSTSNARGFNRGTIYARDGRLVASVVQEGLIRLTPERLGET